MAFPVGSGSPGRDSSSSSSDSLFHDQLHAAEVVLNRSNHHISRSPADRHRVRREPNHSLAEKIQTVLRRHLPAGQPLPVATSVRKLIASLSPTHVTIVFSELTSDERKIAIKRVGTEKLVEVLRGVDDRMRVMFMSLYPLTRFPEVVDQWDDAEKLEMVPLCSDSRSDNQWMTQLFILIKRMSVASFAAALREMQSPTKEFVASKTTDEARIRVIVEQMIPESCAVASVWSLKQLEKAMKYLPADSALVRKFMDAIPDKKIPTTKNVDHETPLVSLVKALIAGDSVKYQYKQLTDIQIRYLLLLGEPDKVKDMIEQVAPYRLPQLMEMMSKAQRNLVVQTLKKEVMGMIVHSLSVRVLSSCAEALARRMTVEQLDVLQMEYYAMIVPKLRDTLLMTQAFDAIVDQAPQMIAGISPSEVGVALLDPRYRDHVIAHIRNLTEQQFERALSVMTLDDMAYVFANDVMRREEVRRILGYNYHFRRMEIDQNYRKALRWVEQVEDVSVVPRDRLPVGRRLMRKMGEAARVVERFCDGTHRFVQQRMAYGLVDVEIDKINELLSRMGTVIHGSLTAESDIRNGSDGSGTSNTIDV